MERKITIVHSPTGHYIEFYADFGEDYDVEDIADSIIADCYVEVENV